MFRNWHRQVSALAAASSGSREHDPAGRRHEVAFVQYGSHRWVARCSCQRWQSPEVCDRKTAWQAHDEHKRKVMK